MFFGISPREAERLHPQERLFLEEAWKALEDAGFTLENLGTERTVGVYVGAMRDSDHWSIANRVSFIFNLSGPSLAIDTGCSSSLFALYMATRSLQAGETNLALVGGVNVIRPEHYLGLLTIGMLSPNGRCRSFGTDADGYVPGEGVGCIVLKPLKAAQIAGDHIYAVIKGVAVNHGGKTSGYTVPNPESQAKLIKNALKDGNVEVRTIGYVEAHGTGTALGDPIEIAGLNKAFQGQLANNYSCAIGSIKSNIGHLEAAAGIAGIVKSILQLKHRLLVPSLHARELNSEIEFEKIPFKVQQGMREWKSPVLAGKEMPLRAGISSFGAGGANAHVIIEEYVRKAECRMQKVGDNGPYIDCLISEE